MLSKTSIVITGMLLQGEMNAYDMLKMIDNMNMQYWHLIGATTLYESFQKKNWKKKSKNVPHFLMNTKKEQSRIAIKCSLRKFHISTSARSIA